VAVASSSRSIGNASVPSVFFLLSLCGVLENALHDAADVVLAESFVEDP
jgi:hypothetical protein